MRDGNNFKLFTTQRSNEEKKEGRKLEQKILIFLCIHDI
jgi:hypothetical protein